MHRLKVLIFACLLVLVGCSTTNPSMQKNPFDRTRSLGCVALPPTPTNDLRPRTPTPNPTQQADPSFPTPPMTEGITPIPITHVLDLNPELLYEDKMIVVVYRCDGTWDEYRLDPTLFPDAIHLSYGDIIYIEYPPASMMGRPPNHQQ